MNVGGKLATFMGVAEEVTDYGENDAEDLEWNVPS